MMIRRVVCGLVSFLICLSAFARTIVVNGPAPAASDENSGTESEPLKTISRAAELAEPGDTVLVMPGVYREHVAPARGGEPGKPIRYVSQTPYGATVTGSDVLRGEWRESDAANCYLIDLDPVLFKDYNPFTIARATKFPDFIDWSSAQSLGQVFIDGKPLNQVVTKEALLGSPSSWFMPHDSRTLQVHVGPGQSVHRSLIEITVRERIFAPRTRGLGYIDVEGFVFQHASNQFPSNFWNTTANAQAGAVGCGSGHHWTIENNVIRYANSIGIDCGSETGGEYHGSPRPSVNRVGFHLIRNNIIEDNGCGGIAGWMHKGTQIVGNTIQRNNRLGIMAWETAGIKFHGFYDGLIQDNLIRDNDAWGIWLDNVYKGSVVDANLILGNLWGGVFLELGAGQLMLTNNVIAYNLSGNEMHHRGGHGIYGHDASGVSVRHNLLYANAGFGVTSRIVSDRSVGGNPVEASKWTIENNLFVGNKTGEIGIVLPNPRARENASNYNIFMSSGQPPEMPRFALQTVNTPTAKQTADEVELMLQQKFESIAASISAPAGEQALSQAQIVPPQLDLRSGTPMIPFENWRGLLGFDHDSWLLAPNSSVMLRRGTLEFHAAPETRLFQQKAGGIDTVELDYFGNPRAGDSNSVGPFVKERAEGGAIQLWPKRPGTR